MKQNINLALVGFGTVGQGVVKIIEDNREAIEQKIGAEVKIAAICDLRPVPGYKALYVKDYHDIIANPDIDIVIELIGGYEPARTLILDALKSGKHVVTANKAVLAKYWDEIFTCAQEHQRLVYFEASVAGAIPVIQGLNEGLAANRVQKISGILNGTTNYILSEMTKHDVDFKAALHSARVAGFAEANPSFDVEGIDTANKLAVLSSLAWSGWITVDDINVAGITRVTREDVLVARKFGYMIKLIGSARMHAAGLELSVQPTLVPFRHTFANVEREYNAVLIQGDVSGDIMFYGKGAGRFPAASAVTADIISLAREVAGGTAGKLPYITYNPRRKIKVLRPEKTRGTYYLRFSTVDRPGVLAKVSGILGQYKVSIASVYQEEPLAEQRRGVSIIVLTHQTNQGNLLKALADIDALPIIKTKTVKFNIEG
jgi:homoserine dehydrogenase